MADKYQELRQALQKRNISCSPEVIAEYKVATNTDTLRALLAERDALREATKLALAYWRDRQQRYKNRNPEWVKLAHSALSQGEQP